MRRSLRRPVLRLLKIMMLGVWCCPVVVLLQACGSLVRALAKVGRLTSAAALTAFTAAVLAPAS